MPDIPLWRNLAGMKLGGKFIVFDGPDGSGKGTQIEQMRARIVADGGECVLAKDPGGTVIGDRLRHVLLGYDLSKMDPRCETLLFMASRAQLVAEIIRPALREQKTVLCDRFISATCAYQIAAGFPREDVIQLGRLAVGHTWPDLTLVLDVPVEVGFKRAGRKTGAKLGGQIEMFDGATTDAMEKRSAGFHRKVRALFRELSDFYPSPVRVVDANRPVDDVHADILEALRDAFR